MAKIRKEPGVFIALFISILIGLFAALPLMRGVPDGADTLLHFYRSVHVRSLMEDGIVFSRWVPDLAYGYGYPIFNYYAPFAYYLSAGFDLLGLDTGAAFLASLVLALICASTFTFLWVRDLFGDAAGLVATAFYALSPYLMVDVFQRGAMAELVALALLPLILWVFRRYFASGRWVFGLVSTAAYAILLLTHNITALIFSPVLLGYLFLLALVRDGDGAISRRIALRGLRALWFLLLGLALSAFFWLPALAERDLVQIVQAFGPRDFNYDVNFLTLGELLSPPYSTDLNLLNRHVPLSLSLLALPLGLLGAASFWRYRDQKEHAGHILFAATVFSVCSFMTLPISDFVWRVVPLLRFVQFPWRFLGLGSFFLAFLAGVGTNSLLKFAGDGQRIKSAIPALLIGGAALLILPWQFTNYQDPQPEGTIEASLQFERSSGYIGTTATGEYLPINVEELPAVDDTDLPVDPFPVEEGVLPEGARLISADYEPLAYSLTFDTEAPFSAVINTFFFEGWQARLDSREVPIEVIRPNGLIGVEVLAGRHLLEIQFETTPVRRLASTVSALALLLVIGSLIVVARYTAVDNGNEGTGYLTISNSSLMLSALAIIAIAALKIGFLDRVENPLRQTRFDGQAVSGVTHEVQANFDNELYLMGADLPEAVPSGERVEMTLYWRAGDHVVNDYSVGLVLMDENGVIMGQSDRQHPGVRPTSHWRTTDYAADQHLVSMPAGTPPGEYQARVSVYEYGQPDRRLNFLDQNGAPAGQEFPVGSIAIARPAEAAKITNIKDASPVDFTINQDISVVGLALPDYQLTPGDTIFPVIYWKANSDPDSDIRVAFRLIDGDGQATDLLEAQPVHGLPSSQWRQDDLWREVYPLLLPATLNSGTFTLAMVNEAGTEWQLGPLEVMAPERIFENPGYEYQVAVPFGENILLRGYDVADLVSAGEALDVDLVWQSSGNPKLSYKSFVQLLDAEGRLVAGSDMIPGNWQRPTTGWIEGEYVIDNHTLSIPADLPAGLYRLFAGMYRVDDGQRLLTEGEADGWFLPQPVRVIQE